MPHTSATNDPPPDSTSDGSPPSRSPATGERTASAVGLARFTGVIRAIGFWAAVVLPFLHIPLLVAGLTTDAELVAFGVLIGLNVVALRIGYSHRPTVLAPPDGRHRNAESGPATRE